MNGLVASGDNALHVEFSFNGEGQAKYGKHAALWPCSTFMCLIVYIYIGVCLCVFVSSKLSLSNCSASSFGVVFIFPPRR